MWDRQPTLIQTGMDRGPTLNDSHITRQMPQCVLVSHCSHQFRTHCRASKGCNPPPDAAVAPSRAQIWGNNSPNLGTSLAVQRLRLCASTGGGASLIPGWETKILQAAWSSQKVLKKSQSPQYRQLLVNPYHRLALYTQGLSESQ